MNIEKFIYKHWQIITLLFFIFVFIMGMNETNSIWGGVYESTKMGVTYVICYILAMDLKNKENKNENS